MELIELVRRAKTGEAEAQSALYEASYKRVYYLALRLTKNPEDAEDATQEAFIAAFGALPNLQNDNAYEGWLFQITANKCRNKLSRAKQTDELPEDFAEHTPDPNESFLPEAVLQDEEKRRLILQIIDNLPDAQRECVMLFYYGEMSVKQIAEMLNCSDGTVKSRLNYARQKIKDGILETEERDGIRLHVFIPFGLFLAQDYKAVTASLTTAALGGASAAGAGAAASGTTATGGIKAGLLATVKSKIIAGVATVAVIGGGAAVVSQLPSALTFSDPAMEQNIRILVDKPEGKIYPADIDELYSIYIFDDGMSIDNWEAGYQGQEPLSGTVPVDSLADLKQFPNLEQINYFAQNSDLLQTLDENKNITTLTIQNHNSTGMEQTALEDLSFLDQLPNIKQFSATISDGTDVSPVERCQSLQELYLYSLGSIRLNADGLPNLLSLSLRSNHLGRQSGATTELVLTQEQPQLRILWLDGDIVQTFSFLEYTPKLTMLDLYASNMEQLDLKPIAGLKELRAVMLNSGYHNCTIDLSPLSDCPMLEVYVVINGIGVHAPSQAITDTDGTLSNYNRVCSKLQEEVHQLMYGYDED